MAPTLASVPGRNVARARYLRRALAKPGPSEGMTWGRVWYVLPITMVIDALRLFFVLLIFTAPLLTGSAAALATSAAGYSGTTAKIVGAVSGVAGGLVELIPGVAAAVEAFGVLMAMIVGVFGFILIAFILLALRVRLSGANSMRLFFLFVGEVTPIADAIPSLTPITYSILKDQIKADKAKVAAHMAEQAQLQAQMRQLQLSEQEQQMLELEAADEAERAAQEEEDAAAEAARRAEEEAALVALPSGRTSRPPLMGPPSLIPEREREDV